MVGLRLESKRATMQIKKESFYSPFLFNHLFKIRSNSDF